MSSSASLSGCLLQERMELPGTRGQSVNPKWFAACKSRITASKCGKILREARKLKEDEAVGRTSLHFRHKTAEKLAQTVIGFSDSCLDGVPAVECDICHEKVALEDVRATFPHCSLETDLGLFLHREKDWLACSPDGMFTCPDNQKVLVEVKCPFSISRFTKMKVLNAMYLKGNSSFIRKHNSKIVFAQNAQGSDYHHQVQLSLHVLDLENCVLCIWKPGEELKKRLLTFEVKRDSSWAFMHIPLLEFYMNTVIQPLKAQVMFKLFVI